VNLSTAPKALITQEAQLTLGKADRTAYVRSPASYF